MSPWLLVALGGALGAGARYGVTLIAGALSAGGLPIGATLLVNACGGLLIGAAFGLWAEADWFASWGRPLLVVGLLGGFTTFSAFSFEMLTLMQSGRVALALGYATLSVVACTALAGVGFVLAGGGQ
ncbi:MAG: CrcB family protein [Pseudomonadota bacterium]